MPSSPRRPGAGNAARETRLLVGRGRARDQYPGLAAGGFRAYLCAMSKPEESPKPAATPAQEADPAEPAAKKPAQKNEKGGPAWPEPTRYGDWERNGRVSDF